MYCRRKRERAGGLVRLLKKNLFDKLQRNSDSSLQVFGPIKVKHSSGHDEGQRQQAM